jgi:uncharacterized protein with HEPN domain
MSHHDDSISMRQMLDHSREAVGFLQGKSRRDLDADRLLNLALVQLLTVVGEAAARVSEAARKQHPQIPWPAIVGMRNRLIHGYDTINLDIVWEVVKNDLPPLVAELERILSTDQV